MYYDRAVATKVMSLRLPDDLREWVVAYAGERGVSQAVVISAAVREFRALVWDHGAPELEEPSANTPAPKSVPGTPGRGQVEVAEDRPDAAATAPLRASGSAAPRAPVKKAVLVSSEELARRERNAAIAARQEILNRAKYGRS